MSLSFVKCSKLSQDLSERVQKNSLDEVYGFSKRSTISLVMYSMMLNIRAGLLNVVSKVKNCIHRTYLSNDLGSVRRDECRPKVLDIHVTWTCALFR